jgi:hypothetical protein
MAGNCKGSVSRDQNKKPSPALLATVYFLNSQKVEPVHQSAMVDSPSANSQLSLSRSRWIIAIMSGISGNKFVGSLKIDRWFLFFAQLSLFQ